MRIILLGLVGAFMTIAASTAQPPGLPPGPTSGAVKIYVQVEITGTLRQTEQGFIVEVDPDQAEAPKGGPPKVEGSKGEPVPPNLKKQMQEQEKRRQEWERAQRRWSLDLRTAKLNADDVKKLDGIARPSRRNT